MEAGGAGGATKKVKGRRRVSRRLARNKRDGQRTCSFQLVSGLVRFNLFRLFRGQLGGVNEVFKA